MWQKVRTNTVATAVALSAVTGTVALTNASAAQAAPAYFYKCDKTKMSAGLRRVEARCVKIYSVGTKKASYFRARAMCDMIRGQGNAHDIRTNVYSAWKPIGSGTARVTCPLRSTLIYGYTQTK